MGPQHPESCRVVRVHITVGEAQRGPGCSRAKAAAPNMRITWGLTKKKSHLPGSTGTPVQGAELRTRIQGRAVAGEQGKGAVRGGDSFPVKGSPGASPGFHPTSPGLLSGASYLTPLSYSFLICKMRIQNCLPPRGAVRTPWGKPGCPALIRASCQLCFNDSSAESSSMFNGAQRVNCRICR